MKIFISNKSTIFCQITLHIKRFIHKRKVVPFLPYSVDFFASNCVHNSHTNHCEILNVVFDEIAN